MDFLEQTVLGHLLPVEQRLLDFHKLLLELFQLLHLVFLVYDQLHLFVFFVEFHVFFLQIHVAFHFVAQPRKQLGVVPPQSPVVFDDFMEKLLFFGPFLEQIGYLLFQLGVGFQIDLFFLLALLLIFSCFGLKLTFEIIFKPFGELEQVIPYQSEDKCFLAGLFFIFFNYLLDAATINQVQILVN